jgi:hypothetical protein
MVFSENFLRVIDFRIHIWSELGHRGTQVHDLEVTTCLLECVGKQEFYWSEVVTGN